MLEKDHKTLIGAARAGDEAALRGLLEPLTRELLAYAYRMLGGFHDAEDALQEARLKAWRGLDGYDGSASFRAWMYRIVTNSCLDMLRSRKRRVLPMDVGPAIAPGALPTEIRDDIAWLEPYPDALLPPAADPEAAARLKQHIRLAFVRAMQLLPPRQRAALILADVLDLHAEEIAGILDTSVAAVNSALQRARATVARVETPPADLDARHAAALARFVHAWETGDFGALVAMLAADASMSMPPWIWWLDGGEAVAAAMQNPTTWDGAPRPGRYRIVTTAMNGQPAGLAYVRGADGRYVPVCLTVIDLDAAGRIADLTVFVLPRLFERCGFPAALDDDAR